MGNVNYGVIGTGYFGSSLARIVHDLEGGKVVAVYDPDHSTEIAKELNCDIENSIEAVCKREDVDAIIIASTNAYHIEQYLYNAQYKKHVYSDKQFAITYYDYYLLIDDNTTIDLIYID